MISLFKACTWLFDLLMKLTHVLTRPWNGTSRCNYPVKQPRKRKKCKRRSPRKK